MAVHLFTKNKLESDPFKINIIKDPYLVRKFRKYVQKHDDKFKAVTKESLLDKDWKDAKKRITF